MVTIKYATVIIVLFFIIGAVVANAESSSLEEEDDDYEYMKEAWTLCNNEQFNPHDWYLQAVDDVLANITRQVPTTGPNYGYYTTQTERGRTSYGYGWCKSDQSADNCFECLDTVSNSFYDKCGNAVGAQMNMTLCFLRYENYPFM